RSKPFSKYYINYNKPYLEQVLNDNQILYRHYGKEFGAQQTSAKFLTSSRYVSFSKFILSTEFTNGINKIKKGMNMGYICILCAEVDPLTCHRSIMVGQGFKQQGINIAHILKNQELEYQSELENRLINCYIKNSNQLSFLYTSKETMLEEAYNRKNKEIGFKVKEIYY
ncbi:MAG: hypothetical protein ATN32_08270, partial [Candidatus Epulonipiscium fishelsonii]